MSLSRSIQKLARFIRTATDIKRLEQSIKLDPSDTSAIQSYVRELVRSNKPINPSLNSIEIAQEYLLQLYNKEVDLSNRHLEITGKLRDLTWLGGLSLPDLKSIYLYNNYITSLNGLSTLHAPNLTDLTLSHTNLTSLRGLSELDAPNLTRISISNSPISSLDELYTLQAPNLKIINLYSHNISPDSFNELRSVNPSIANTLNLQL